MPYDKKKLRLRRFEVQVHYHAAYLFWNLRGILAERWAHGPHFGGYQERPDHVTLVPGVDVPNDVVGVYGLKFSAFNWERTDEARGRELALEWLADCLEVLQPSRCVRVETRIFFAYELTERQIGRVADSMRARSEGLARLASPDSGSIVNPGMMYHVRGESTLGRFEQECIYGTLGRGQSSAFFASPRESDPEWILGVQVHRKTFLPESQRRLDGATMKALVAEAFEVGHRTVGDTIMWDARSV